MDCYKAHDYCFANKTMLMKEKKCGCFCCFRVFSPTEIDDWYDDEPDLTAVCPYCSVDSVIGESVGYPLTEEALRKMGSKWFNI